MMGFKKANNVLVIAIVVINLYTLCVPLMPALSFWWQQHVFHASQDLRDKFSTKGSTSAPVLPDDNRLVIPEMALNAPIFDGTSPYTVNKGIWRFPASSTPDKGGNTVLIGHRFTYHGAAVFYHLDLAHPGTKLVLFWQKKPYYYQVSEVKVVPPSDTSIEQPTDDARLTIYTCTPLWTAKNRLVVIARPMEGGQL